MSVFLFPAFIHDYSENPGMALPGFAERFVSNLQIAANAVEPELALFDFQTSNFLNNELVTQYVTFLYSCSAASVLRENNYNPEFSTGYSMGIYAALYDAASISIETGLKLISLAYHALLSRPGTETYGMGAIIGLNRGDIQDLIDSAHLEAEITNQNAAHSFVVSGSMKELKILLSNAIVEGALHTRLFEVSIPYHHSHLRMGAAEFEKSILNLEFQTPINPIISLVDQKPLMNRPELRTEVVRNLFTPLNWLQTNIWLLENGVTEIIECGPSKNLARNSKFIPGNYRFCTLDSILSNNKLN